MADDRHYVGGEWYRICDRTGFKVRDTRTRKQWNNILVRDQSWEPRQPQDFVQGVMDDQTVSDPRPRSINVFIGPLSTNTTAALPIGTTLIPVITSLRMQLGDIINVMMTNGEMARGTITDIPSTTAIQIVPGIPWPVAADADVVDLSAVSPADI